jgi:hypothetical protein
MNLLFEIYGLSYPIVVASIARRNCRSGESNVDDGGHVHSVHRRRWLLCPICRGHVQGVQAASIRHWMLLRIHDPEESPVEVAQLEQPVTRAA